MFNFHELMRHFDMAFTACCLVPVVLLTNICRVHEGKWLRHVWMEFALDFVLGFVLFRFAVFIGVISDITSLYTDWVCKMAIVAVISFILMILHVIMLLKHIK